MHAVVYAAHNHIIQLLIIIIIVVAQSQPIECVANDADNTHTNADCTGTCLYHASLCDMHTQYTDTHTRTNKRPQFRHEILINIWHDFRYKCVKMNTHCDWLQFRMHERCLVQHVIIITAVNRQSIGKFSVRKEKSIE